MVDRRKFTMLRIKPTINRSSCLHELSLGHDTYRSLLTRWQVSGFRGGRQNCRIYMLDPTPPSHNTAFGTHAHFERMFTGLRCGLQDRTRRSRRNWRIFRRLIGHDNDVSRSGLVIRWNNSSIGWPRLKSGVGRDILLRSSRRCLNHQSHVKGIAFERPRSSLAVAEAC